MKKKKNEKKFFPNSFVLIIILFLFFWPESREGKEGTRAWNEWLNGSDLEIKGVYSRRAWLYNVAIFSLVSLFLI